MIYCSSLLIVRKSTSHHQKPNESMDVRMDVVYVLSVLVSRWATRTIPADEMVLFVRLALRRCRHASVKHQSIQREPGSTQRLTFPLLSQSVQRHLTVLKQWMKRV